MDNHWASQELRYDLEAELSGTGSRGKVELSFNHYIFYKKAVLPQGNRAMPQVFFSVAVRQQHSLQV